MPSARRSCMAERRDDALVSDIRMYLDGLDYAGFLGDIRTQDAVVRNLEILGEAAKRLSPEFRAHHPQIEWSQIAGMRDRLIHHSFGVNWEIVWNVVQERLPDLIERSEEHTSELQSLIRLSYAVFCLKKQQKY